jgi:hypothetical protein
MKDKASFLKYLIPGLAALGVILWSASLCLQGIRMVFSHQAVVPFWDQWFEVTPAQQLHHFFQRNAEHVIASARVVYIFDELVGGGRNTFSTAMTFVLLAFQCLLLCRLYLLSQSRRPQFAAMTLIVAFVLACLFSMAQWENLAWGFQVVLVENFFLATLAFTLVAIRTPGWRNDILVAFVGVAASFTMANGVLVPLLVLALAFLLGYELAAMLRLSCAVVIGWSIFIAAQFFYQTAGGNYHAPLTLEKLWPLSQFLCATLASPFLGPNRLQAAVEIGALGIGILAVIFVKLLYDGGFVLRRHTAQPQERARLALLTLACFCLISCASIAIGRAFQGIGQAFSSRYSTGAIVFWVSLLLLFLSFIPRRVQTAGSFVLAIGACVIAGSWLEGARWSILDRELMVAPVETAMLADVPDWLAYLQSGPQSRVSIPQTPELRRAQLSVFSEPWSKWLGKPVTEVVSPDRDLNCHGAVESSLEVSPGGWQLMGWSSKGSRLLVLNSHGIVAGYGKITVLRPDIGEAPGSSAWIAHAQAPEGESISILSLLPNGRDTCRIVTALPLKKQVTLDDLESSELGPVRVSLQGKWVKGSNAVRGQVYPHDGSFFESYNGSDSNVGILTMEFQISAQDPHFVLPYTAGPYPRNMGLRVGVARSGVTISELILQPSNAWTAFDFEIPDWIRQSAIKEGVVVEVVDDGSGWGQWLAVGLPHKGNSP